MPWFTPQMATSAGRDPGPCQEPGTLSVSHMGGGAQALGPCSAAVSGFSRELDQKEESWDSDWRPIQEMDIAGGGLTAATTLAPNSVLFSSIHSFIRSFCIEVLLCVELRVAVSVTDCPEGTSSHLGR